jgi:hypothetical protein
LIAVAGDSLTPSTLATDVLSPPGAAIPGASWVEASVIYPALGAEPKPIPLPPIFWPSRANDGGGGTSGRVVRHPLPENVPVKASIRHPHKRERFTARLLPDRQRIHPKAYLLCSSRFGKSSLDETAKFPRLIQFESVHVRLTRFHA